MNLFILIFKSLLKISAAVIACVLLLEVVLRFLPVATGLERPIKLNHPIPHWEPNSSYAYSNGWNLRNPQHGTVNNMGFVDLDDYRLGQSGVAIIGDSFVEAIQVPFAHSLSAQVQQQTGLKTFNLGKSGAQLADYIVAAKWADKSFKLSHMVINIRYSDLPGSLQLLQNGGAYFSNENGTLVLNQSDYDYSDAGLRNIIKQSALMRYVFINLKLSSKLRELLRGQKQDESIVKTDVQPYVNAISREMQGLSLAKNRITFVIDSDPLLSEALQDEGFNVIRSEIALDDYLKRTGYLFDFSPYDQHWNYRGHRIIADQITKVIRSSKSEK